MPDKITKRLMINGDKLRKLNLTSISPGLLYSKLMSDAHNKKTLVSTAAAMFCADVSLLADEKNRPLVKREQRSRRHSCARSRKNCSKAAT